MSDLITRLVKEESQRQVGRRVVKVVDSPDSVVSVKRQDALVAGLVAEGSEVPSDHSKDVSVAVVTSKIGVVVDIPLEWLEDNNYEFGSEKLRAGIKSVYRREDELIFDELIGKATNTFQSLNAGEGDAPGLALVDVTRAMKYVEDEGYPADRIIINPQQAMEMRNIEVMATLERRAENYEVEILVSNQVPSGTVVVTNSVAACLLVVRRPLTVRRNENNCFEVLQYVVGERVAPVVVRPNLVCTVTGC